ncbi:MAG: AraC family transcriptional regulator [Burkholderiaceae bacterium]|nr:AraC family transcriptional regulator [Burkholderiaceae bacterium]
MSTPPPALTRLIVPRFTLASCVRAYITRSTVEQPLLEPAKRFNHYPATPHCAITWFIEGDAEVVEPPHAPDRAVRVVFTGPQSRPLMTYNPGPVRMFMVMFYPQALHALTGLDIPDWVNRWDALEKVLPSEWAQLGAAVLAAPDDTVRLTLLEAFLEPRWQAVRPGGAAATASDWVRHLAWQVADTSLGRGVRSIERHIKARAGQPLRRLLRLQRAEALFFDAREEFLAGRVVWSEVAARGGYSDQAHLCRETREITGHSPHELARVLKSDDESYWIYRIWL